MTDVNPQTETVNAEIRIGNHSIRFSAQFTNEAIQLHELLPFFQNITDRVVEIANAEVIESGKRISCHSGCGACCSQLVPISKAESAALLNLIESLPEARRSEVRSRFAKNIAALEETGHGLFDKLEMAALDHDKEQIKAIGLAYFDLNLPCPFLQDQSCSIHPHRPLSCREFLVVSDPAYCAKPDPAVVENVVLPKRVSSILYSLSSRDSNSDTGFMPLIQLLASAESIQIGQPTPAPAIDWVNRFLERLGG
ncbi:MAG: YkgJ family cysteine cluster protein [Candidatus Thiodiazotropha endolucinida]